MVTFNNDEAKLTFLHSSKKGESVEASPVKEETIDNIVGGIVCLVDRAKNKEVDIELSVLLANDKYINEMIPMDDMEDCLIDPSSNASLLIITTPKGHKVRTHFVGGANPFFLKAKPTSKDSDDENSTSSFEDAAGKHLTQHIAGLNESMEEDSH